MVLSAEWHAAQIAAAAVVVAAHGGIGLKASCECTFVGPCLAAEALAGAQPSAGAPLFVAVESRMADHMQPAPRPDGLERADLAGSVLDQAKAIAAAVVSTGLPHSGRQPAGDNQPSEPPGNKSPALLYVNGP